MPVALIDWSEWRVIIPETPVIDHSSDAGNGPKYCLNLIKTDLIATEAHGKTRKNNYHKILFSVSFRVLPWLLNKLGAQLKYSSASVIIRLKKH